MAKFTAEQLFNHLYNKRLPQVYREADIDAQYCLKRFLQAMIEGGFTDAIKSADEIVSLTDPLKCPDEIFPYLFKSFGYTYSADIPMIYQRKILNNHGELFRKRGSIEYIYILTRILTGFECSVEIKRVNGVRVLTVTMFVDNSVTSVESQYYITLVKKFVSDGYIPFYLDVETNIVVDVVDIKTAQQYIGMFVDVEGQTDLSPICETSQIGFAFSLYPTLINEPFTKFNILGYSRIVPKYLKNNILNPNTVETNTKVTWVDLITNSTTTQSMDLYTDYLYVPYGNNLYINLSVSSYTPPTVYIYVYTLDKVYKGSKVLYTTNFVNRKCVVDLADILVDSDFETDYYVRIGIIDNKGVNSTDLLSLISVWVEDTNYDTYSAVTRFRFDNEYYRNGEPYPTYMVDIYDSNGPISLPYCSSKEITSDFDYNSGKLYMLNNDSSPFIAYCDCISAMKDEQKYYISFSLVKPETNTLDAPIVTALCTNSKGTYKQITLKKEVEGEVTVLNEVQHNYGYTFTIPKDYNVVRIKFYLCNASIPQDYAEFSEVMCYECDPNTGNPYIDCEFQPYRKNYETFENNLTVGIDGIALLSYNDSDGKVIVRDSFDVLTGLITRRVGVNYDSLGNPVSVYRLASPYTEQVEDDFNGYTTSQKLSTFMGKTYISMCQSIPYSRYVNNGGSDYHSAIEFTTKIIK